MNGQESTVPERLDRRFIEAQPVEPGRTERQ